jgi:hypothetical protein
LSERRIRLITGNPFAGIGATGSREKKASCQKFRVNDCVWVKHPFNSTSPTEHRARVVVVGERGYTVIDDMSVIYSRLTDDDLEPVG